MMQTREYLQSTDCTVLLCALLLCTSQAHDADDRVPTDFLADNAICAHARQVADDSLPLTTIVGAPAKDHYLPRACRRKYNP